MKNISKILLVMLLVLNLGCSVVFADPTGTSLDDVIDNNTYASTEVTTPEASTGTTQNSTVDKETQSFLNGISKAGDLSPEVEGVQAAATPLKTAVAFIVQLLSYVIVLGMTLSIVLDITYIAVTPLRGILGGGQVPRQDPQAGAMGGTMGGYGGNSMMGGYGASPMGGYGARGGYGASSMGGYGANPAMQQQQNMMQRGRINLISQAAIDAVGNAGQMDPATGKVKGALSTYARNMIPMLVAVPILLVLAITGSLTNLGFLIADLLVDGIAAVGEMLGGLSF